jgi:hypothetical protein
VKQTRIEKYKSRVDRADWDKLKSNAQADKIKKLKDEIKDLKDQIDNMRALNDFYHYRILQLSGRERRREIIANLLKDTNE